MKIIKIVVEYTSPTVKGKKYSLNLNYSEEHKNFLIERNSLNYPGFGIKTAKIFVEILEEANKLLLKKK